MTNGIRVFVDPENSLKILESLHKMPEVIMSKQNCFKILWFLKYNNISVIGKSKHHKLLW